MKRIDCDVHPGIPELPVLTKWMDAYWTDHVTTRGLRHLDIGPFRKTLPTTAREDWRPEESPAAPDVETLARECLDTFGIDRAILNPIHGGSSLFNSYFAAAVCSAVNGWLADEWLAKDDRLRGAISVPVQEPDLAVKEIEARADDARFVQILFPAAGDMPFGRRYFWPIYRAAEKHCLPIAIHPGGGGRFPQGYDGWHSSYAEDMFLHAGTMQGQMLSLVYEGVFQEFPGLHIVLLESGISWLPAFMTDTDNKWVALRREVPWVGEAPSTLMKRHFRFTTQPFDAPSGDEVRRIVEMIGSEDVFLFSTDYPHWTFDGDNPLPPGLDDAQVRAFSTTNPSALYGQRLEAAA